MQHTQIQTSLHRHWLQVAQYSTTLAREFSGATPENCMKWGNIHPSANGYNWADADALVNFAAENGLAVHGHTLVWHQVGLSCGPGKGGAHRA